MALIDFREDGFVLTLLALMCVMLGAGLTGAYRVFGVALVAFIGMIAGRGFARRHDPVTWVPPAVITSVLLMAFAGMFAYESAPVRDADDAVLGFQRGTAFLVYALWVPAFFTTGLSFALVFDRLEQDDAAPPPAREVRS